MTTSVRALFALPLLAAGLLLACSPSPAPAPTATPATAPGPIAVPAGQPLVIGVSAALSGDAAPLGADLADAVDLAIADAGGAIAGHPLVARRADDGCSDPEKATNVARELAGVAALAGVVGPMCTTGAQAADRVYEAAGVLHILPTATRSDLSAQGERYFFRTAWRDDAQAQVQARYARATMQVTTVVLVDDGEPYGTTLADAFAAAFTQGGGRVVARQRIQRGTIDFTTLASQVTAAAPDAVVYEGLDPEGALVVKALRAASYTRPFIAADGVLSVRDFIVAGGGATDGAIVTGGAMPDAAFAARFKERTKRDPSTPFVLQAYDAATLLIRALRTTTFGESGALSIDRGRLADALRGDRWLGLTGALHFDAHGDRAGTTAAELGLALYRVANGRFEPAP